MSKDDTQKQRLDNTTAGGHSGGTKFGQQPGEAKGTPVGETARNGDKARPNDGKN